MIGIGANENSDTVVRLEATRHRAMLRRDMQTLERLCHRQLSYTHSTGVTESAASYLERCADGRYTYTRLDYAIRDITVVGGVILVSEILDGEAIVMGQARALRCNALAVWTHEAEEWRLVGYHATPLSAQDVASQIHALRN